MPHSPDHVGQPTHPSAWGGPIRESTPNQKTMGGGEPGGAQNSVSFFSFLWRCFPACSGLRLGCFPFCGCFPLFGPRKTPAAGRQIWVVRVRRAPPRRHENTKRRPKNRQAKQNEILGALLNQLVMRWCSDRKHGHFSWVKLRSLNACMSCQYSLNIHLEEVVFLPPLILAFWGGRGVSSSGKFCGRTGWIVSAFFLSCCHRRANTGEVSSSCMQVLRRWQMRAFWSRR